LTFPALFAFRSLTGTFFLPAAGFLGFVSTRASFFLARFCQRKLKPSNFAAAGVERNRSMGYIRRHGIP